MKASFFFRFCFFGGMREKKQRGKVGRKTQKEEALMVEELMICKYSVCEK